MASAYALQAPADPVPPLMSTKKQRGDRPPTALWAADLSPAALPGPELRAPFPPTDRSTLTPDRLSPTYSRPVGDRITGDAAKFGRRHTAPDDLVVTPD